LRLLSILVSDWLRSWRRRSGKRHFS
jgi:hypothetical protein